MYVISVSVSVFTDCSKPPLYVGVENVGVGTRRLGSRGGGFRAAVASRSECHRGRPVLVRNAIVSCLLNGTESGLWPDPCGIVNDHRPGLCSFTRTHVAL